MPIINVHILKGASAEARTRLAHGLTDAMRLVIPAPPESFTVLVNEIEKSNYMRGGAARRADPELPDAREVVRSFLAAVIAGEFLAADALVTEDCVFHLPAGVVLHRPHELMEAAGQHWSRFHTRLEGVDMCGAPEGAVVYARQRFSAAGPDGLHVDNVLTVSRFEFRGPLIRKLELTSDITLLPPGTD